MRRFFLILGALFALLPLSAQQTQDALYIYRNDGIFHGFFFADIEKIEFSRIDTLGVEHQDYVVQEVYALDSIYRIPISAIDSVGFITPETKYKEGVITSESTLWDYVNQADPNSFHLSGVPSDLIPQVGDKLCNMNPTPFFPNGIYGEVAKVKKDGSDCWVFYNAVALEELFEQHVFKIAAETKDEAASSPRRAGEALFAMEDIPVKPITYTKPLNDWGVMYPGKVIFSGKGNVDLKIAPKISLRAFYAVGLTSTPGVCVELKMDNKMKLDMDIIGTAMIRGDLPLGSAPIPIGSSPFALSLTAGVSASMSATLDMSINAYDHSLVEAGYNIKPQGDGWKDAGSGTYLRVKTFDSYFVPTIHHGKAALQVGCYSTVTLTVAKLLDLATVRGDCGRRIALDVDFDQATAEANQPGKVDSISTAAYDMLNLDNNISVTGFNTGKLVLPTIFPGKKSVRDLWAHSSEPYYSWSVVPKFTELTTYFDEETQKDMVYVVVGRKVLTDMPIGFAVYDKDGKLVVKKWCEPDFAPSINSVAYTADFTELEKGETYTIYPLTKLFGVELTATPWTKFQAQGDWKLKVNPHPVFFDANGGKQKVTITFENGMENPVVSLKNKDTNDWLTISDPSLSDNSQLEFTLNAEGHKTDKKRIDSLCIAVTTPKGDAFRDTVPVVQKQYAPQLPIIYASRTLLQLPGYETAELFGLRMSNAKKYHISKSGSWLDFTYYEKAGALRIHADDNGNSDKVRKGYITIVAENEDGVTKEIINVEQDGGKVKYNGLWVEINTGNHQYIFPVLIGGQLPAYCQASVNENGAFVQASDYFSGVKYLRTQRIPPSRVQYKQYSQLYSTWRIILNVFDDGKEEGRVCGWVEHTSEEIHRFYYAPWEIYSEEDWAWINEWCSDYVAGVENEGYRITIKTTTTFELFDVPFYDHNVLIPYTDNPSSKNYISGGFRCGDGYEVSPAIEQELEIINPEGIAKYIRNFSQHVVRTDGKSWSGSEKTETTDDTLEITPQWSVQVGLFDPKRGSVIPYSSTNPVVTGP